jgi:hypothetical protein
MPAGALETRACHKCWHFEQTHQTFRLLPGAVNSGTRMPFRFVSHSAAKAGYRAASEAAVSVSSAAGVGIFNLPV